MSETSLIVSVLFKSFYNISLQNGKLTYFFVILLCYLVVVFFVIKNNNILRKLKFVIDSKRLDLLIILFTGIFVLISINGIGILFLNNKLVKLQWFHMFLLLILPIVFFVANNVKKNQTKRIKKAENKSGFMSDLEVITQKEDAFEFADLARKFSDRVFNYGSYESLVFGVDAPWGTGKSTFINLCVENWEKDHKEKIIIYKFDVMKFESNDNILNKFVDGLIKVIRGNFFAPELETLFARYLKILNDSKTTFSIFGVRFGIPSDNLSIDKTLEKLEDFLKGMDRKIIIIVDDLDRLNFSSVKEVLYVIKKSFVLPNMTYILCYDTENISINENQKLDAEKTIEFLEKFINIKYSLFLDPSLLLNYFTDYKNKAASRIKLGNADLVSVASEGLKDIFNSKEYDQYVSFVGNARKIKRLVNTILLLELDKVDYTVMDFNKYDLIHLIIIYVNYPNIFRKIYDSENGRNFGYFSVVTKYDDYYPMDEGKSPSSDYKNSTRYTDYVQTLNSNQKFILNKVFDTKERLQKNKFPSLSNEAHSSYACFNKHRRNLNRYLDLIVKSTITSENDHYKFYVTLKNQIFKEKVKISEVLEKQLFVNPEFNNKQLWSIIVNEPYVTFSPEKVKEIILYLLEILPKHSILEIDSTSDGLRNFMYPFFIAKLLNDVGWLEEKANLNRETKSDVKRIAEWIFGEKDFSEIGILDTLFKSEKGVLGLHDLLQFRSNCNSGRRGDFYTLLRSLSTHGKNNNPVEGDVKDVTIGEMREISQVVFNMFKKQYINESRNIFEDVINLSGSDLCGEEYEYIKSKIKEEELNKKVMGMKPRLLHYILYQLGCKDQSDGLGCGFYDESGYEDQGSIHTAVNKYLFDICFNSSLDSKGYDYFLFFLFINYDPKSSYVSSEIPSIDQFTKVLNKEELKNYWIANKDNIKKRDMPWKDTFSMGSYETTYTAHIQDLFKLLDQL
ncbi:P-loop NTPase fold protein [Paenibacillus sp. VT-400]|uniref:P-loop NTPase fold protein n=1 Tax=Paenibacillus sp. VT-400 TaxID=1495853 RepID=UPI0009E58FD0|nr:P-loop NTPase fold protein [Paenibacillus sp. VT-400]